MFIKITLNFSHIRLLIKKVRNLKGNTISKEKLLKNCETFRMIPVTLVRFAEADLFYFIILGILNDVDILE